MPPHEPAVHEAIGRAIHDLRSEQGYTQEVFALKAGVNRPHLSAIERGEFNLTTDTLFKIAAGLGVSVPQLLAGAGL